MANYQLKRILITTFMAIVLSGCSERTPEAEKSTTAGTPEVLPTIPQDQTPVDVKLNEYEIIMPNTFKPGPQRFKVTNTGKLEHNFEVEGQGIEKKFDAPLKPGETKYMDVNLSLGSYTVYCPVGDHKEHGMKTKIDIIKPM
jgi:plastocyanin